MHARLFVGLIVLLLAGCAEGPPHLPPADAPAMSLDQVIDAVRRAPGIRTVPPSVATAASDIGFDSDRCEAGPAAERIDPCVFGDRASAVHVVLYGDSYAGMWLPAMIAIASQRHWRLQFYGKPGCLCDGFQAFVAAQIRALRPSLVVVANASGAVPSTLRRGARRLVVLGGFPVMNESAPECLARNPRNIPACFTSRREATARVWNGEYVSVLPWLCSSVCTPVIAGVPVYRNRFYLTATYARMLSGVLAEELDRVSAGSRP